mmetsp:Transcript_25821/g.101863  ORF Transcript_25821/g.101863 Transcript_25821/m.101863 type:complete len:108 (+) Transcript_25821:535-858(+)
MEDYETLLSSKNSHLLNRTILRGHSDTVEGLAFNPEDSRRLVSGGDDKCVFFWDTRKSAATGKINDAHQGVRMSQELVSAVFARYRDLVFGRDFALSAVTCLLVVRM